MANTINVVIAQGFQRVIAAGSTVVIPWTIESTQKGGCQIRKLDSLVLELDPNNELKATVWVIDPSGVRAPVAIPSQMSARNTEFLTSVLPVRDSLGVSWRYKFYLNRDEEHLPMVILGFTAEGTTVQTQADGGSSDPGHPHPPP